MESSKLALVVLGSHRSGTSVMTHVMALSGFALPKTILPPQADNPSGFWESSVIVDLNDEILAMRDTSWDDVFPQDDAPLLANSGAVVLAKAEAAIASEFGGASPIVLKDPRVSILVEFWRQALERQGYESAFVIMVRNPVEVAASLAKRNGFSQERGLLLWLTNMLAAERKSRGSRRLFVSYERLLEDVFDVLEDVETMIGAPLPRRTDDAKLEVQRALNGELRHHRATAEITVHGELESLVADVYSWLSASSSGKTLDTETLDRATAHLRNCEDLIGGVVAEIRGHTEKAGLDLQNETLRAETFKNDLITTQHELIRLQNASKLLQEELAAYKAISITERTTSLILRNHLIRAEINNSQEARVRSNLNDRLDSISNERHSLLLERNSLKTTNERQHQQIADLNKQTEFLTSSISYIQSRFWYRGITLIKRFITQTIHRL